MTRAANLAEAAGSGFAFRNRIINGDMRIDARNAGAAVTPAANTYALDRFFLQLTQSSKFSFQQSSVAPTGFSNSLLITSASAYSVTSTDTLNLQQRIEGFNFSDCGWGATGAKSVTLSFQIYSSLTGTFGGSIRNSSANRSYPFTYSVSAANTWTPVSITIPGDTSGTWVGATNGIGAIVSFDLGSGSTYQGTAGSWASANYISATGATSVVGTNGATFYITGVQLEKGTAATPFEFRPYGAELALCQRYFEKSYEAAVVPGVATSQIPSSVNYLYGSSALFGEMGGRFLVPKRSTPTVTFYNPDNGTSGQTGNAVTIGGSSVTTVCWHINFATQQYPRVHFSADAEL